MVLAYVDGVAEGASVSHCVWIRGYCVCRVDHEVRPVLEQLRRFAITQEVSYHRVIAAVLGGFRIQNAHLAEPFDFEWGNLPLGAGVLLLDALDPDVLVYRSHIKMLARNIIVYIILFNNGPP